ncbi:hypothetical protein ACQJBY_032581 [Aegilops geniculata]
MEVLEAEDRPSASWRHTISITGHRMGWSTRQRSHRYVVELCRRGRNRAGEEARHVLSCVFLFAFFSYCASVHCRSGFMATNFWINNECQDMYVDKWMRGV